MNMKITKKGTKKFSKSEKLKIINEAKEKGVKVTLAKYGVLSGSYYYWKKRYLVYGEDGLNHQKLKASRSLVSRLEKEIQTLKLLLGEKELESKLKDDLLKKKVSRIEKETLVRMYMGQGLARDICLNISGLSKYQFYNPLRGKARGRRPSKVTERKISKRDEIAKVDNVDVVSRIVEIKLDPDRANYYRLITCALQLEGYFINHKKVYRLMNEYILLEEKSKGTKKKYVQHRRVVPIKALQILEMDIKYIWVDETRKYAYILTVIDTFTRYVLHWSVGYSMKSEQVKEVWEYIVAHYIQEQHDAENPIEIEVRNDNGKQFSSKEMIKFFEDNELTQVFTHPYTPEENGHIESFHKTLGKSLKHDSYSSLEDVEKRLEKFYTTYNNFRSHGSIKGLPPAIFWALCDLQQVKLDIDQEKRNCTYKLKVAPQSIMDLPGIHDRKYRVIRD